MWARQKAAAALCFSINKGVWQKIVPYPHGFIGVSKIQRAVYFSSKYLFRAPVLIY
jgi:hypothetical protein